jgi:hypothetical protein
MPQSKPPFHLRLWWQDGRVTAQNHTYNPFDLVGAPQVGRNPKAILRIEIMDPSGVLETVWDARWNVSR